MFHALSIVDLTTLPVTSPELKFLVILGIILIAPLILDRLRIPHILGLIIAGALVGEHGFNILERDSGIVMSGTAGLLYIMFLAGLEIDINEFVKNRWKSIIFGLYTFAIPMAVGTLVGIYMLKFSLMTSLVLASMFASHTLLAYPIISKLGVKRNRAVTVTIGGTVIAETLALLVLAVIVGMTQGDVDATFWVTMTAKLLAFGGVVFFIFPIVARYILKRCSDGLTQYIFVLFMLFLGSILAQAAGIEGIIGALFTGLALNRLIPSSSTLMNRIEFVGNAIFIPFFLIGVGMLIDYRVFISDMVTIYTAFVMTVVAIATKYAAAYITQKRFGYSSNERSLIFGLSSARAAATLAVVLVGYNVILGYGADGEPIRLLNSAVLNGTIVMIFITCSVASIAAQRGAYKISLEEAIDIDHDSDEDEDETPKVLLPLNSITGVSEAVSFANLMAPKGTPLTVASVISDAKDEGMQVLQSKKIFDQALHTAVSADHSVERLLRYDVSYTNGITNIIRENSVSDLVLLVDPEKDFSMKLVDKIVDGATKSASVTTFMYRPRQPIATLKRYLIIIPPHAELELGFKAWITRVWALMRSTGATAAIYATRSTIKVLRKMSESIPISLNINEYVRYRDLLIITRDLRSDDCLIFVLSRKQNPSYESYMADIPRYLNSYFANQTFLLIYPYQGSSLNGDLDGMTNDASINAVAKIEDILESVIGGKKREESE